MSDRSPLPPDLESILQSGEFVLFIGAGASIEAGLPDWPMALERIAVALDRLGYSPQAEVIRSDAKSDRFLEAAEQLYLAPLSVAERSSVLREVFGCEPKVTRRLKLLVTTRCQGLVTTNFDTAIDLALTDANRRLIRFTESSLDLANARIAQAPFFVRLHGRVEVPENIVLADRHYRVLPQNKAYIEYFRHLFFDRNLIFFGFSFRDPFITTLLDEMSAAVHSVFRRTAFALMPAPVSQDLCEHLKRRNIRVFEYDPSDGHDAAWALLAAFREGPDAVTAEEYETSRLRSHVAAVYARAKAKGFSADRHRVLAGLLVPVLSRLGRNTTVQLEDFFQLAERQIALPQMLGRTPVVEALRILEEDNLVLVQGDEVLIGDLPLLTDLQRDGDRLVSGVGSRASVRFGETLPPSLADGIRQTLLSALLTDGLHLAHSIVKGNPLHNQRLQAILEEAVAKNITREDHRSIVRDAVRSLLETPDPEEQTILMNISAVAFSTALLLADPILAESSDEPFTLGAFVDASVLLPWISDGHPLQKAYDSILKSFDGGVRVLDGYLNEIVTHRQLALEAVAQGELQGEERVKEYAQFFQLHNINTFIAGYAGTLASGGTETFVEYLTRVAPFTTEAAAGRYFQSRGIAVEESPTKEASALYGELLHWLKVHVRRNALVLQHDARQIEILAKAPTGRRPFFITADRQLIAAVAECSESHLLKRVLLPYQVGALAQLASRGRPGLEAFARTMWNFGSNAADRVRRYYTDKVLAEYEYALVTELPVVLSEMFREFEREGVNFSGGVPRLEGEDGRLREFAEIDRFNRKFYEFMDEARRRAGLNTPEKGR